MKKKIIATTMGIVLLTTLFVGCGKKEEVKESPVTEEVQVDVEAATPEVETQASDELIVPETPEAVEETKETDYEAVYKELLDRYYLLVNRYIDIDLNDTQDGEGGVVESTLATQKTQEHIGYAIRDISGDGVPELVIGAVVDKNNDWYAYPSGEIYAVFTSVNEKPQFVFEGWARNIYMWLGDGRFYNCGSNGAIYSTIGTFAISEDGTKLNCEDFYFTYEKDETFENIGVYYNKEGKFDKEVSEELDMTVDDLWKLDEEILKGVTEFEITPFSEYAYDGELPETAAEDEDGLILSACYEEESYCNDYDVYEADASDYRVGIMLTAKEEIGELEINKLTLKDYVDDKMVFDEEMIYHHGYLGKEKGLLLKMTFNGDTPSYGVSFVDGQGNVRKYAIGMSGFDGSVVLEEYGN